MEEKIENLERVFRSRFGTKPRFFQAPGRVNLIGEHTDYNEGFVMPFAIDRRVTVAGAARVDSTVNAYSLDLDESLSLDMSAPPVTRRGNWADHIEGVMRSAARRSGLALGGADLCIASTVPIGAGLSSSAAMATAVGYAVLALNGVRMDGRELAFAAQEAEHKFVGINSGLMDQLAAVFGKAGSALLMDCRSLELEYIPFESAGTAVVGFDTKVKHTLASSEYNRRREECEEGVRLLSRRLPDIKSLRDVRPDQLEENANLLPSVMLRRCRHVISENSRTLDAASAFKRHDLVLAGRLMSESHRSLRDDYEVSCAELDALVETARVVDGVYGARMTGGGFGGCTVNLVRKESVGELREKCETEYTAKFGLTPEFYVFQTANGASEVTL